MESGTVPEDVRLENREDSGRQDREEQNMRTYFRIRDLLFVVVITGLVACPAAMAGIPEPPTIIYGSLQTSAGLPVMTGELRFEFVPVGGGATVRSTARVGSLSENYQFVAFVGNERTPVAQADQNLELGGGKTYTPRVYYNGVLLSPVQLDSPFTPERARIIGPLTYTVSPTGKVQSVSHDIDFGFVPVGSSSDRTFQISSVGTETIAGLADLANSMHYRIMVGAVSVSQLAVNLAPGQSMDVTVRFEPTTVSDLLTDTFRVQTDAGDVDRTVAGNSAEPVVLPDPDINGDGRVDDLDLFTFLQNWYTQVPSMPNREADLDSDNDADARDLLEFLDAWHQQ